MKLTTAIFVATVALQCFGSISELVLLVTNEQRMERSITRTLTKIG
jgi:hypothetical protein